MDEKETNDSFQLVCASNKPLEELLQKLDFDFYFAENDKKIEEDYLEYTLQPLQLYASGIMYRIKTNLRKNGLSPIEAFSDNSRNRKAFEIISSELIRCNYSTEVGNFREMVKGHVDIF